MDSELRLDKWFQEQGGDLEKALRDAGTPATTVVARAGLLGGRRHTSNGPDYLKRHVPDYTGSTMYVDAPAVRDRGLITASGLADVEFAEEIMAELGVLSDSDRAYWTSLFRGGRLRSGAA